MKNENTTLDLSYILEMTDAELFVEIGDALVDWEVESNYENHKELRIAHAAEKELISRGWKLGDRYEVQMVPLSNELMERI